VTYQMTRARLRSIGHPDSRYRDLTIPLCDPQGAPVDSLLWLANGGGKTSLLSLLFALVLPLRRDFMGADDQERALEEYVQSGDTAHVAIEWVDLDAGGLPGLDATLPRLVTGMVHEWAGRAAPADRAADKSKLSSLYYSFTAIPGELTLESLPILADDGVPRTIRDYTEALRETSRLAGGALDLETFQNRRTAWADYLEEALGIDPGLYRYQVRMNSAEGAVAKLFRFRSSREFIEFLIEFTAGQGGSAARALETTTDNVRTLLGKLAARPRLAVEQKFSSSAAERLLGLHTAGEEAARAEERRREARERSASVSASLVTAADRLIASAAEIRSDAGELAARIDRTAADRRLALARAAQYDLEDARLAEQEARAAHERAGQEAATAHRRDTAWRAVPVLADLAGCEGEITQLRDLVAAETESARPLRDRHDRTATALRETLAAAVAAGQEQTRVLEAQLGGLRVTLADATRARTAALEAAAQAGATARQHREQARTVRARSEAEAGGPAVRAWLDAGENPGEPPSVTVEGLATAAVRAEADEARARAEAAAAEHDAGAARARLKALAEELTGLSDAHRMADRAARDAGAARDRAVGAMRALAGHERLRALAELDEDDPLDLHALGPVLTLRLTDAAARALAEFAADTAAAGAHEAVRAAVAATGFAPAAGDTAQGLAHLEAAGIRARAGWEVLRELVPDRAALVRALLSDDVAMLAAGAVVDSADLERARDLLARGDLTTAALVAVVDPPAVSAALARASAGVGATAALPARVPADPALYDRQAAENAHARREEQAGAARDRAGRARAAAEADRALAAQLKALLEQYPAHELARLETEEAAAGEELARRDREVEEARQEQRDLTSGLDRLAGLAAEHQGAARRAEAAAGSLRRAGELLADAAGHERSAVAAQNEEVEARERAENGDGAVQALTERAAQAEERLRAGRADVADLRAERERIQLVGDGAPATDLPASGPGLDRLRAEYAGLRREWESQTSASQAAIRLADAENRRRTLLARLPADEALLTEAHELLAGPDGATQAAQTAAGERATHASRAAAGALTAAESQLRLAERLVAERRPAGAQRHAELTRRPAGRPEAQASAQEARERALLLEGTLEALAEEQSQLVAAADRVASTAESLRGRARELDAGRQISDPAGELVQGPVDDELVAALLAGASDRAGAEVERALSAERRLADDVATARRRVAEAAADLRRLGATAEFKEVPDVIRNRVLGADTDELIDQARTLAADLRQRATLIGQQLADLDDDTGLVTSRLVTAVRDVLADLARAERYARMPEGTGTWSQRSFLTVRSGPVPDNETIADRLRPVLDRFAANPDSLVAMSLLKECVLAGAGGPQAFRVRVLKPNAPGQELEDITKLQKFSGGEKLTVCVALYCVLAKLRAHNAGRDGGGGTLVLDNPLGTASHTRLLSLQRQVAAAHGVQLVYATGVNDLGAVGEFAHRVRLRKTWHSAVGRSYVDRTDDELLDARRAQEDRTDDGTSITAAHVGRGEA
jgi:hypothetical protein